MDRAEILKRLDVLLWLEMTVHQNATVSGETPEAVDRELDRISKSRSNLLETLNEARDV